MRCRWCDPCNPLLDVELLGYFVDCAWAKRRGGIRVVRVFNRSRRQIAEFW